MKKRAQDYRRKRGRKFKLDEPIYNLRMEMDGMYHKRKRCG
jgi:hypothetical protein